MKAKTFPYHSAVGDGDGEKQSPGLHEVDSIDLVFDIYRTTSAKTHLRPTGVFS